MNGSAGMRLVGLLICLGPVVLLQTATGAETYVTRTNWVENAITNVVEVRMPKNVFVNEYHTNWIDHVRTNVVTKELPRQVVVDFVHTNVITHYSTNYFNKSEERTLYIDLMSTNFEGLRSGFEDSLIGKAQAGQAVVQTLRFWGRWCPGKRR